MGNSHENGKRNSGNRIFSKAFSVENNFNCRKAKGRKMTNLNSILIEGYLLEEPLYHVTPKGTPVCTFKIVTRKHGLSDGDKEEEISHFNIEAWGKLAESIYATGHKDRGVRIVGRLKEYHWIGSDGKQSSRVFIVAEHLEFRPEGTGGPGDITKPAKGRGKKKG
jgi:single-strand DNA-binding protein